MINAGIVEFRFHTGSIRSGNRPRGRKRCLLFRFHTGSIRSGVPYSAHRQRPGFDSILVRLEAEHTKSDWR